MKLNLKKQFYSKGIYIVLGTALYKVGYLVKDIALTSRLGLGSELSLFVTGYLIPNFLSMTFGQAVQINYTHSITKYKFLNFGLLLEVFKVSFLFTLFVYPITYILLPFIFPSSENISDLSTILLISIPVALASPARNVLGQSLFQSGHPLLNFSLALITSTTITCYALMSIDVSAYGLATAVSVGITIELLTILGLSIYLKTLRSFQAPTVRNFPFKHFFLQSLIIAPPIIDQLFSGFYGARELAVFNYAYKVPGILVTLTMIFSSSVLLPFFIENNTVLARSLTKKNIARLSALIIVTMIMAPVSSDLIVKIIFQRGNFTPQDASAVSAVMSLYFYSVAMTSIHFIYVRYLNSKHRNNLAIILSLAVVIISLAINLILLQSGSSKYIPLASLISYVLVYSAYVAYKKFCWRR